MSRGLQALRRAVCRRAVAPPHQRRRWHAGGGVAEGGRMLSTGRLDALTRRVRGCRPEQGGQLGHDGAGVSGGARGHNGVVVKGLPCAESTQHRPRARRVWVLSAAPPRRPADRVWRGSYVGYTCAHAPRAAGHSLRHTGSVRVCCMYKRRRHVQGSRPKSLSTTQVRGARMRDGVRWRFYSSQHSAQGTGDRQGSLDRAQGPKYSDSRHEGE